MNIDLFLTIAGATVALIICAGCTCLTISIYLDMRRENKQIEYISKQLVENETTGNLIFKELAEYHTKYNN